MARPMFDSEYLYGFHDAGGEGLMTDVGTPGWVVIVKEVGADPNDGSGDDFTGFSNQGLGVIVRLNHSFHAPNGTLPRPERYQDFARRCGNYVRNSRGCRIWIIGNEPNLSIERPGGEVITPQMYAQCYRLCHDAIHQADAQAQVLTAAVGPWNAETTYPGNELGDWVRYFVDMLNAIGVGVVDGITLHTYTHGHDRVKIRSEDMQRDARYARLRQEFRSYRDFMAAIPSGMKSLPVYITEVNPHRGEAEGWEDKNDGWVQEAYAEINEWNQRAGNQVIRALVLYRWSRDDRFFIGGKNGVLDDFRRAVENRYKWPATAVVDPLEAARKRLEELKAAIDKLWADLQKALGTVTAIGRVRGEIDQITAKAGGFALIPQEVGDLLAEIATLEKPEPAPGPRQQAPQPPLEDWVGNLPQSALYPTRELSVIRQVIIHHTATRADIPPKRLAEAQMGQGRPGITYHFVIAGDGVIFATQPLEAVTSQTGKEDANGTGVAVALAGNFTSLTPTDAQMASAASLIAWLLTRFGLGVEAVVGRSNLEAHGSPGEQWEREARYKDKLLAGVQAILEALPPVEENATVKLRQRIAELEAQVADLQGSLAERESEVVRLEAEVARLKTREVVSERVERPEIIDIVDSLPKNDASEWAPYKQRPLSAITTIVIHHTATGKHTTPQNVADGHIRRGWPGIGYHYVIRPDGVIYQCQRHETVSFHTDKNNSYTLGVNLVGCFMRTLNKVEQPPEDQAPTEAQLESASHLVAWLMQELNITGIERVMGHKEVPTAAPTACPGEQWAAGARWKDDLLRRITAVRSNVKERGVRPIRHYLLLWDHGPNWASADWESAQEYITRFRTSVGFTTAEAMAAQRVLIVGGVGGVSGDDEEKLRQAGIEVYRIDGKDEADTRRRLHEIVQGGTPWPGDAVAGAPADAWLEADWVVAPGYDMPDDWPPEERPGDVVATMPPPATKRSRRRSAAKKSKKTGA